MHTPSSIFSPLHTYVNLHTPIFNLFQCPYLLIYTSTHLPTSKYACTNTSTHLLTSKYACTSTSTHLVYTILYILPVSLPPQLSCTLSILTSIFSMLGNIVLLNLYTELQTMSCYAKNNIRILYYCVTRKINRTRLA